MEPSSSGFSGDTETNHPGWCLQGAPYTDTSLERHPSTLWSTMERLPRILKHVAKALDLGARSLIEFPWNELITDLRGSK